MRKKIPWMVLLGAGGIFALAVLLRRPEPEPVREHRTRKGNPGAVVDREPVSPVRSLPSAAPGRETPGARAEVSAAGPPAGEFWAGLGILLEKRSLVDPGTYRQEILSRTADYLELDPPRASLFQSVAIQTVTAIQDAWKIRDAEVLNLPDVLEAKEHDQREQEIQDRYETAKRLASYDLESLLVRSARHEEFRRNLGEWIDAVR